MLDKFKRNYSYELPSKEKREEKYSEQCIFDFFSKLLLTRPNISNEIFDLIIKKLNEDLPLISNETKNNHIIPCSYFAQWTKDYMENGLRINKNKTFRRQTVKTKSGIRKKLNNFMQIDNGIMQELENCFTGYNGSLNIENCKIKDYLESLSDMKVLDFINIEIYSKTHEQITKVELTALFSYKKLEENDKLINYKKSKIDQIINHLKNDSFHQLIYYLLLFEIRQKFWTIAQENSLVNIIAKILESYKETKSFFTYSITIEFFSKILKMCLIDYSTKYNLFNIKNLMILNLHTMNIKNNEKIEFFIILFLNYIKNKELSNNFKKRINSVYMCDLEKNKNTENNIYIISSEKILKTANLPIFELMDIKIKVFALSPHLLVFQGSKVLLSKIKLLDKNSLIELYEKELEKRTDCDIILLCN